MQKPITGQQLTECALTDLQDYINKSRQLQQLAMTPPQALGIDRAVWCVRIVDAATAVALADTKITAKFQNKGL